MAASTRSEAAGAAAAEAGDVPAAGEGLPQPEGRGTWRKLVQLWRELACRVPRVDKEYVQMWSVSDKDLKQGLQPDRINDTGPVNM